MSVYQGEYRRTKRQGIFSAGQEDRLKGYCMLHRIKINGIYIEYHSAKTFNRPEWRRLLIRVKDKRTERPDLVLFTKWDRFSRNTSDAYQMISMLNDYGIGSQAVEQPLDLAVPENKMMLAIYLSVPEVENDRRSLNVFYGMRRAKKEGRWMAIAPVGYMNRVSETGTKYITPHPLYGKIMKYAFEELAKGVFAINEIWRQAAKMGLQCGKNQFWVAMRNPVYCGKIFIPAYKEEEACFVQGLHQSIISEDLFYQVQDLLDGRRVRNQAKMSVNELLPLRGFLVCPRCGRNVTGSPSKGKCQTYFYYHCISICAYRVNTTRANADFLEYLGNFVPNKGMKPLFEKVIKASYGATITAIGDHKRELKTEREDAEKKLLRIKDLLIEGTITSEEYRAHKIELEHKVERLERQETAKPIKKGEFANLAENLVNTLENLEHLYLEAGIEVKREIVGILFPEKLEYENGHFRTPRLNKGAELIYLINSDLWGKKNETSSLKTDLSREVLHHVPLTHTLIEDIRKIISLTNVKEKNKLTREMEFKFM